MASYTHNIQLNLPANQAYMVLRNAGSEIPGFKLVREDPQGYTILFSRGFGWTNPVDINAGVWATNDAASQIQLNASILALADPFSFLPNVCKLFQERIDQHVHSLQTGAPLPPPRKDGHAIKMNLIIIGALLGFIGLMFLFVILMILTR
ncbi:MAG: hypothetical protein KC766_08145 [Myxococcales bacterium]|nr:hypothetical protein [Myxococcales bacterium]